MTNFGWSLPPGVSLRDIEEAMGEDEDEEQSITPEQGERSMEYISPERQIENLLNALQGTANCKPYSGQLNDIRNQIDYIRQEFAKFQANELESLPTDDPFVEF